MKKKEVAVLGIRKPVIAMIHVQALPGTPAYGGNHRKIIETAVKEASFYQKAGVDILMIENMHDRPYLKRSAGPEITAMMTAVALAVAKAASLDFIRAEGFVFAHVGDEGLYDSDAGTLLRYRRNIDAENVSIFTDIKKKHSAHAITADVNLAETAAAAEFFLSDGIIVTGTATGEPATLEDLELVKQATNLPVLVGSGITIENLANYMEVADALIVGSFLKKDGKWFNAPDPERIRQFMDKVNVLRG